MSRLTWRLRPRGAALLLVIAVIVALVIIATPFALSMRLHESSARRYEARTRARYAAKAGRNLAVRALMDSHPSRERQDPSDGGAADVDGVEELEPPLMDLGALTVNDPRGAMYDVRVKDERGKIDINSASPFAIAGLLGATVLTTGASYEEDKVLEVEDTSAFYSDGDPRTIDGVIRMRGEYIAYRHTTPTSFEGLIRGLYLSRPMREDDGAEGNDSEDTFHFEAGTLICDARAWKISFHAMWSVLGTSRSGELNDFDTPSSLKSIADWEYGSLRLALELLRQGVTLEQLRAWGVADSLAQLQVDPAIYERPYEELTEEEQQEREDMAQTLREAGIDPDEIGALGPETVERAARRIIELGGSERGEQLAERLKQRVQAAAARKVRVQAWLEKEVPQTVKDLLTMQAEARDIETIGRVEMERLRPHITALSSHPEGRWTDWEVIQNQVLYNAEAFTTNLRLQDARHVVPGTVARLRPLGGGREIIRKVYRRGRNAVSVLPKLEDELQARTWEVCFRIPAALNINTASREALTAAFLGVQVRGGSSDQVTPTEAARLADAIIARGEPFTDHTSFAQFLLEASSSGVISPQDAVAIAINGINPAEGRLLRFTVPFTFATEDLYRISSVGIMNDPAGKELARHSVVEVVQVAPPEALELSIDSQYDFEDRLGFGPLQVPHPNRYKSLLQTAPVNLTAGGIPDRSHDELVGDIRLATAELPNPAGNRGSIQHYQAQQDGAVLPQPLPGDLPVKQVVIHPAVPGSELSVLGEGTFQAWIRFDGLSGGRAVLFDIGDEQDQNRLVAYYDGATAELVLRLTDECLDQLEPAAMGLTERRAVELRGPVSLRPQNWYHIALSWQGPNFGDLAAFVDGRFIGTREPYVTYLSSAIDAQTTRIPVEDTSEFPDRGLLRIGGFIDSNGRLQGGELVEYISKTATSFVLRSVAADLQRRGYALGAVGGTPPVGLDATRYAARGSGNARAIVNVPVNRAGWPSPQLIPYNPGLPHSRRCPVVIHGYASPLRWEQRPQPPDPNTGEPQPPINIISLLPVGGATLAQPVAERTPITLLYRPFVPQTPMDQANAQTDIALGAGDSVLQTVWSGAYPDAGLALGGFPPTGILLVNQELISYSSLNPATGQFLGLVRGILGTMPADHRVFSPVVLLSIEGSGPLTDYVGGRVALTQSDTIYEWLRVRRPDDATYAQYFLLPLGNARQALNQGDWSWLQGLYAAYENAAGQLPPTIAAQVFASTQNATLAFPLKEWLKRAEPVPNGRAQDDTGIGGTLGADRGPGHPHPAGTKLIPVFSVESARNAPTQTAPGPFDVVTVTDDSRGREEATVLHAYEPTNNRGQPVGRTRVALLDFVTRPVDGLGGGRLCKWPTGLMIPVGSSQIGAPTAKINANPGGGGSSGSGGSAGGGSGGSGGASNGAEGPIIGYVDETKLSFDQSARGMLTQLIASGAGDLGQLPQGQLPRNGQDPAPLFIKLGTEVVALTAPETLVATRGMIGSRASDHGAEATYWVLPFPEMTVAESGFQGQLGESFTIHRGSGNGMPATDGYLALDRGNSQPFLDIVSYARRRGQTMQRPVDRLGRGVYDNRFGSGGQGSFGAGDVLVELPVRFHDRYRDQITSLEGTYLQFSRTVPGAWFESLEWDAQLPSAYSQIVFRVRVDGEVAFDAARLEKPGQGKGLLVYKDPPDRRSALGGQDDVHLIRRRGDQIDIQVWFTFRPGAYANDAWKQSAILRSLKLRYWQPTRVHYHRESSD